MRMIWSALVVLVLLAPFGGVGITSTPIDEPIAAPRGGAASLAKLRVEREVPPFVASPLVASITPIVVVRGTQTIAAPVAILSNERHPSAGPRDPPV